MQVARKPRKARICDAKARMSVDESIVPSDTPPVKLGYIPTHRAYSRLHSASDTWRLHPNMVCVS